MLVLFKNIRSNEIRLLNWPLLVEFPVWPYTYQVTQVHNDHYDENSKTPAQYTNRIAGSDEIGELPCQ